MDSALTIAAASSTLSRLAKSSPSRTLLAAPVLFSVSLNPHLNFSTKHPSFSSIIPFRGSPLLRRPIAVRACSDADCGSTQNHPFIRNVKTAAGAVILAAAAASVAGKFRILPARAETPLAVTTEEATVNEAESQPKEENVEDSSPSPMSKFLESNSEAVEALKALLQQRLEAGEDEEALKVLRTLVSAQPDQAEWKFLMARLLNEMGNVQEAREAFEEILKVNPLSFEALFENALLMDRCGEGEAVIQRLDEALRIAEEEEKMKEARDVRLIMAQIQFLQRNVDEALKSYEELAKEDPNDFRPYFCKGMIYSLLDRNKEAREEFAKYRELSPRKFEVEGYLRTPLSRTKLFGTGEEENDST